MTSHEIRAKFLDFFASKGHKIVPSAPVVRKNDPTLMFTNSGMAPFKDCFLGNLTPPAARVADSQKCLRVSGKHNDLEDVGLDGTHHTLFEMLGNWSFGDYFKEEAIAWSWELLTEVYGMEKDRLYATVFEGDAGENLEEHTAAYKIWLKYLPKEQILFGNKKDNFWEMGEQGPCGPCSEIHYDVRSAAERAKGDGASLVNVDDSGVVEIWNNVFMKYNRKADGSLEDLPARHVDTGMGFERLCMVLQNKDVTYETDVFRPYITYIETVSGKKYTGSFDRNAKTDIAMRVCADHIRAVAFTIADGQLPASNGAGYVIRRILRRAVRYYFSFLEIKEPFLATMIPILAKDFATVFPELYAQRDFVEKVVLEEERSFLRTLESGLKLFDALEIKNNEIAGKQAFQLLDTFGFPIDLTELIAAEKGFKVDMDGFKIALQAQKDRSKTDAAKKVGDWCSPTPALPEGEGAATLSPLSEGSGEACEFVGYEQLQVRNAKVLKYRMTEDKKGLNYQLVLTRTPFYGESGGQAGDSGYLLFDGERIEVLDTKRENELIIHIVNKLPENIEDENIFAQVNTTRRQAISANHTGAHLLHAAIHEVIGEHAVQKGQSVDEHRLRFDISHFQAVTKDEISQIERLVNQKIRQNIALDEQNMAIEDARKTGAMMLFGEKYGETVRVIAFDKNFSIELCGGTHVQATGELGYFKIVSESALAAGVRRFEAVTAEGAAQFIETKLQRLDDGMAVLKNPQDLVKRITTIQDNLVKKEKEIERIQLGLASIYENEIKDGKKIQMDNDINFYFAPVINIDSAQEALTKKLLEGEKSIVVIINQSGNDNITISVAVTNALIKQHSITANGIIKQLNEFVKGGGRPEYASGRGVIEQQQYSTICDDIKAYIVENNKPLKDFIVHNIPTTFIENSLFTKTIFDEYVNKPYKTHIPTAGWEYFKIKTSEYIRKNILKQGKVDFNKPYIADGYRLESYDLVDLYCHYYMQMHYMSSLHLYNIVTKKTANLIQEKTSLLFLDIGCGAFTSGAAFVESCHLNQRQDILDNIYYLGLDVSGDILDRAQEIADIVPKGTYNFININEDNDREWIEVDKKLSHFDKTSKNKRRTIIINLCHVLSAAYFDIEENLHKFADELNHVIRIFKDDPILFIYQNPVYVNANKNWELLKPKLENFDILKDRKGTMLYSFDDLTGSWSPRTRPDSRTIYFDLYYNEIT